MTPIAFWVWIGTSRESKRIEMLGLGDLAPGKNGCEIIPHQFQRRDAQRVMIAMALSW